MYVVCAIRYVGILDIKRIQNHSFFVQAGSGLIIYFQTESGTKSRLQLEGIQFILLLVNVPVVQLDMLDLGMRIKNGSGITHFSSVPDPE